MKTRAVNDSSVFCSRDESTNGANWATRQSTFNWHSRSSQWQQDWAATGQRSNALSTSHTFGLVINHLDSKSTYLIPLEGMVCGWCRWLLRDRSCEMAESRAVSEDTE